MGTLTPWVTRLLIANFAVFFLQQTFPIIDQLFVLVPRPFTFVQRPWTLVSYMFLHGSFGHIFFNMLVVFFFGPRLESRLGAKQFLWLYFISGIGGALLSFVFAPRFPIIGASAGVFGVMLAFAMFWPREHILLWFVIPVQIRYLVAFMTAFAVVFGFGGARDGIAHFAHLGGFVGAFLYLK